MQWNFFSKDLVRVKQKDCLPPALPLIVGRRYSQTSRNWRRHRISFFSLIDISPPPLTSLSGRSSSSSSSSSAPSSHSQDHLHVRASSSLNTWIASSSSPPPPLPATTTLASPSKTVRLTAVWDSSQWVAWKLVKASLIKSPTDFHRQLLH